MSDGIMLNSYMLNSFTIPYYETEGTKGNVLILHGWAHSKELWISVIRELGREGFRVVAPDLPGFGDSTKPKVKYTYQLYMNLLCKFWNDIKGNFCNSYIVGHSFGGTLALKLVDYIKFKKAVVISTPIRPVLLAKVLKYKIPFMYQAFSLFQKLNPFVKFVAKLSVNNPSYVTEQMLQAAKKQSNRAGTDVLRLLSRINLQPEIETLKVPSLFIIGQKDRFVLPKQYKNFEKRVSKEFRLLRYDNCGHTVFLELKNKFLGDLNSFLRE